MKRIRDQMFSHMQTLPIRYFDTHSHGGIMSHYTNDTDTLRQIISMSIPQNLLGYRNHYLGILRHALYQHSADHLAVHPGNHGVHFRSNRQAQRQVLIGIGEVNGYIEEMIEGQRVVQVFCHEGQGQADFDKKNDSLCEAMTKANTYANILMPAVMSWATCSMP